MLDVRHGAVHGSWSIKKLHVSIILYYKMYNILSSRSILLNIYNGNFGKTHF